MSYKLKYRIGIYALIDLMMFSLLFILIIPFFVDLCSILFVKNSFNLFAFAKLFPVIFNFVAGTNLWINGIFFAICIFYITYFFYFNVHFYRVICNKKWWFGDTFAIRLFIYTTVLTVSLVMIVLSVLNTLYYLNFIDAPIHLIALTLIPCINIFTLFYWIPMFFIKGWPVVFLGLNLIWFIVVGIVTVFICLAFYKFLSRIKTLPRNLAIGLENDEENQENFEDFTLDEIHNKSFTCQVCNIGFLEIKESRDDQKKTQILILSCSNINQCQFSIPLKEFALQFFQENGFNIYKWEKECWKCQKLTSIYTYFPSYQLKQVVKNFNFHFGGPGLFPTLDEYLKNTYKTIDEHFSKKLAKKSIVNNCFHCHASQSKYLTIENPSEILNDINDNKLDEKYLDQIVDFNICQITESEVTSCIDFLTGNNLKS